MNPINRIQGPSVTPISGPSDGARTQTRTANDSLPTMVGDLLKVSVDIRFQPPASGYAMQLLKF